MRKGQKIVLLLFIFCSPSWVLAAKRCYEPSKKIWSGSVALGGVMNTGNTNNANINGKATLNYNKDRWQNTATASGQLTRSDAKLSGSRADLAGDSRYFFEKRSFIFGNGTATFDRFSPYDYVFTVAAGYGLRLIDKKSIYLDAQIGPGWRGSKVTDTGEEETNLIVQPQLTFGWQITEASKFQQILSSDIGYFENRYTYVNSQTSLETKIIGNLGMQVSYTMEYNSSIPARSKNKMRLDTLTNIALIYNF